MLGGLGEIEELLYRIYGRWLFISIAIINYDCVT